VEILAEVLASPLPDPMTPEVVAVPTRGVERWLAQRLSHCLGVSAEREDGVCANVTFPFPGVLVNGATAAATGIAGVGDPWAPERSVWPLLELVDAHLGEPFLEPLAAHLRSASPLPAELRAPGPGPTSSAADSSVAAAAGRPPRRFATVRHLADLYDHYGVHRPEMVQAWAAGDISAGPGAAHRPGAPGRHWQAELWLRLRRRIGVESPAERFAAASARLAADPGLLALPSRVSLFGLTRLPASHLTVLRAIAAGRDVHLFLLYPSGALWRKVASAVPGHVPVLRRADDPTATLPANPLLRSWGRDAREMQLVLASHGASAGDYRPVIEAEPTLLRRIQADIRADRQPPAPADAGGSDPRPELHPADTSFRIHSCHGRSRQVEVLRDAVLHLLAADPSLEPRDVIIMCPDIETFAPLVHAAFGAGDRSLPGGGDPESGSGPAGGHAGIPELRVRLADRSLLQTNPLLAVAGSLLEMAAGRVTASQVLDLAWREPVRRRFRFDDDGRAQLERWVAATGVRWGLDGEHRRPWGLGGLEANTWDAGLDRLLLGVAMAEDEQRLFGGTLPVDDVAGGTVELAGHLAEMIDRLGAALGRLTGPQPVRAWQTAIAAATESLAEVGPGDEWQRDQLYRVLDEAGGEAGDASADGVGLELAEIRALLSGRLQGRPTRANFRTGDLTVCTLVPMRSVPHRVVCLLGLDDGVFPRHTERDGDDLLATDPHVGDRDARSEDRQLLLDAVLAATDHLLITFGGRDERTNRERPPAVPIAELLDVVDHTVRVGDGGQPARRSVLVQHPLQPFDPRNFTGELDGERGRSFDPVSLGGAVALSAARRPRRPFLTAPLPPLGEEVIQLDSLIRFVEHPVRAFLRDRLGWYAGNGSEELDDALPIELDALEKWGVGDRLLAARLAGADLPTALTAELARGILPPGRLVDVVVAEVAPTVEALVDAVNILPCATSEPQSWDVNVQLPDGRLLIGSVPGLRDGTAVRCLYSRLAAKHRLAAWVRFLALTAAWPDEQVSVVVLGRGRKRRDGRPAVRSSVFAPFESGGPNRADLALGGLAIVVDLYDRGMREPLPLYCDTSAAWAEARRDGADPAEACLGAWKSAYEFPREDREIEHELVLGGVASLEEVLRSAPAADEHGPGWSESEDTRFGRLARRLWDAPLRYEHVEER
jgi:exodeoxyribonuclease V gamma subunit